MAKNGTYLRQRHGNVTTPDPRKEQQKKLKASQSKNISKVKCTEADSGGLVFPSGETAFKAFLSARFCAAIWCNITDCDETFNYWEPTHYLVYGKGLQTWEYSPEYALRSYTYLLLHAAPTYIYQKLLQPNPLLLFYLIRCLLGLVSAITEVYFYKAVCREFGVNVGRLMLAFQVFSTGMFIAGAAYLPSSWAMYMNTAAMAAWWHRQYPLAIFFTALSSLLGWPFAALLGVPIAVDMLIFRRKYKEFIQWSIISAVTILGPMTLIDSAYFGRLVIAPLNIIKYNIFTQHGPNLYGTEKISYYLINGFLNFNIIWVFALITPLILVVSQYLIPVKGGGTLSIPYYLSLSPLYLWLLVFFYQPHKEERFLFPVYPMICLCGAVTTDAFQKLYFRWITVLKLVKSGTNHYLQNTTFIMIVILLSSTVLSMSRSFALYYNYRAPINLMMELNSFPVENRIPDNTEIYVCFGKDWYRYPTSFFLPNNNWNVRFIKSEFNGMLPAPYVEADNGTQLVHDYFNDMNVEDSRSHFNISKCHFLLDLDLNRPATTSLEPNYASMKNKWTIIKSVEFLNTERSHKFFRAFYLPFINDRFVQYGQFHLLQANKPKLNKR